MAKTYEPIATYTVPSSISSYEFSAIPATYTDLILVISPIGSSTAQNIGLRFNSDTGGNYSETSMKGTSSTTISSRATLSYINVTEGVGTASTLGEQVSICHIQSYANTSFFTTVLSRSGKNTSANVGVEIIASTWRNTAAVNSITLVQSGAVTFSAGTTFNLYGIKAA